MQIMRAGFGDGAANCSISSQKESSRKKQPMLMESSAIGADTPTRRIPAAQSPMPPVRMPRQEIGLLRRSRDTSTARESSADKISGTSEDRGRAAENPESAMTCMTFMTSAKAMRPTPSRVEKAGLA